jgi:hypothetical protein
MVGRGMRLHCSNIPSGMPIFSASRALGVALIEHIRLDLTNPLSAGRSIASETDKASDRAALRNLYKWRPARADR